jgi:hypothetical protein
MKLKRRTSSVVAITLPSAFDVRQLADGDRLVMAMECAPAPGRIDEVNGAAGWRL